LLNIANKDKILNENLPWSSSIFTQDSLFIKCKRLFSSSSLHKVDRWHLEWSVFNVILLGSNLNLSILDQFIDWRSELLLKFLLCHYHNLGLFGLLLDNLRSLNNDLLWWFLNMMNFMLNLSNWCSSLQEFFSLLIEKFLNLI
jgi:hypothetical protein